MTEVARAPSLCSRVVDRIPSQNFTPTALQPRYHLHCLKQRGPGGGLWQLPDFCLHLGNEDPALPTPLGNMQTLWAAHLEWWTQTPRPCLQGPSQPASTTAALWPSTPQGLPLVSTSQ